MRRDKRTGQQVYRSLWRAMWRMRGWLSGRNWLRSKVTGWPEK